jgi:CRP-like cAMP-binding protein
MSPAPPTNRLIAGLPAEVRQRLLPHLERVWVSVDQVLHESGSQMSCVYFPTTAVVSLVYETADGASMELAVVGSEGIIGVELLLGGGATPSRAATRTAGEVLRLPARVILDEFARAGSAMQLLLRYMQALITQVAQTAVCARHHSLDRRLCRWLLMSLDRGPSNEIVVTQERIAHMLGVRREGVTQAALRLQMLGLIQYARGHILALDRMGLEEQACECYAVVKKEYDRLLPETVAAPKPRPNAVPPLDQATAPNKAPTPAVIAIASAPQKQTRPAPARTLAPPARAATAPSSARNESDKPATHGVTRCPGANAATVNGNNAPTAKLAADANAA